MKKEEILEKSRQENKELDERQKTEQEKASIIASNASILLTAFFAIVAFFKGAPSYPFVAIIGCNLGVLSFLNYRIEKKAGYKVQFVSWIIATVIFTILYIWKG